MDSKFLDGCTSCENYTGKSNLEIEATARGSITVNGEVYEYVVIQSAGGAAKNHLILTTTSHHVGAEMVEVRAALNAEATIVASKLLGESFRIVNNSGPRVSTLSHYHAHLISPGEGERLSRVVVNVQEVIRNIDISEDKKDALRNALLQQRRTGFGPPLNIART